MTDFDPEFALEVMQRRQGDKNREAANLLFAKFRDEIDGKLSPFGSEAHQISKRVHALWDEADSYKPVIKYLEDRIWNRKTFAEKTWALLEERDARTGLQMVEDVIEAQRDVVLGWRP